MNIEKGNITCISNLYPVDENKELKDSTEYLQHIEDPKRIFDMKCNSYFKYFNYTKRQEHIFRIESGVKCKINPDVTPIGAIIVPDGTPNGFVKEVCKCQKEDCEYYSQCKECMA